jgi:hypothetical protein
MKVKFKYGIKTYSGTVDEMVYGSFRDGNLCIGREYVYPKLTDNNALAGKIISNLASVYHNVSPAYLQDLKTYTERNGKENTPKNKLKPTVFALFIKMMYAWQESDSEHVDLQTVAVADIVALDAPVKTIAGAIEEELLPSVSIFEDLTSNIQ